MVPDDIALTTSKDILEAVGRGEGPDKLFVSLGYAGWEAGQLEHELAQNAWLTVPADAQPDFRRTGGNASCRSDANARRGFCQSGGGSGACLRP